MITGTELFYFADGADVFYPRWPAGLSDEHEDLIAALFDNVQHLDISGDLSFSEKRHACRSLNENIEELAKAGFIMRVQGKTPYSITGGVSQEPQPWRAIDIEVQPFSLMQMVDADGNPIKLDDLL